MLCSNEEIVIAVKNSRQLYQLQLQVPVFSFHPAQAELSR